MRGPDRDPACDRGQLEWALGAIVFAAILDGVDGRLARLLKGQSKFGAELDSLADFVNFGVVPGLILYFWGLNELRGAGWIACLVFAICMCLRLARFNVMAEDPNKPIWAGNFFTGVPAPAGAIIVMLPIYLNLLGTSKMSFLAFLYVLFVRSSWCRPCRCCPASASASACRRKWCCRSLWWWCCSSRCS